MNNIILIVSNNASRTGAPILLLNFLQWIKKNSTHQFVFILRTGGELLDEYREIGEVYLWETIQVPVENATSHNLLLNKISRYLFNKNAVFYTDVFIKKLCKKYKVKLIFSNTATNGDILSKLGETITAKIVTYVHEGERLLEVNNKSGLVSIGLQLSYKLIAVSNSVKKVLIDQFHLSIPIVVIPGAIDTKARVECAEPVFENEKIPYSAIKIMACGYPVWQKGIDLFIQIANKLCKERDDVHFIWMGGSHEDEGVSQMLFDINKLNLNKSVTLISNKPNPVEYFDKADIFLVLSRNESFSLVTIEAGLLKKPVLCFDKTGGPCEIIEFSPEFIVPYADINKMSERINELIENPTLRLTMGEYLYKRVMNNYCIEKNARDLLNLLEDTIENNK